MKYEKYLYFYLPSVNLLIYPVPHVGIWFEWGFLKEFFWSNYVGCIFRPKYRRYEASKGEDTTDEISGFYRDTCFFKTYIRSALAQRTRFKKIVQKIVEQCLYCFKLDFIVKTPNCAKLDHDFWEQKIFLKYILILLLSKVRCVLPLLSLVQYSTKTMIETHVREEASPSVHSFRVWSKKILT